MVYPMKKLTGGAIALCLAAFPLQTLAQGMEALSFNGDMEFEYTRRNGASGTLVAGNLMLRYNGSFGFELGGDIYHDLETGADTSLPYLAVSFGIGPGQLALGAPQTIVDQLIDLPAFAGSQEIQNGLDQRGPSAVTGLAQSLGEQIYGLRYSGESGALRYGATLARIRHTGGTHWQVAGEYQTGGTQIEGALEGEDGSLGLTIGANHDAGQFDMGLYLTNQRIVGTSRSITGYIGYDLTPSLTLRGHLRTEDGTVSGNRIGVEAEYGFSNGAYAQFGAADGNNSSMSLDASVGFKF